MRIYFDGCAKTAGFNKINDTFDRYSKLLSDKLGAEEYNIAVRNGSNKRIIRNLLEHDLSKFDLFVIQMTKRRRFEVYNKKAEKWISIGYDTRIKDDKKINYIVRTDETGQIVKHMMSGDDIITTNESWQIKNNTSDDVKEMIRYLFYYFDNINTEEQAKIDEMMCFHTIKSILKEHKHIIIWIGDDDCDAPVDLKLKKGENYITGWYFGADKHKLIYQDILERYENIL
tara:strand:+ start:161 stop:847 length:687 start_codon:yes stop_codon:yes gene_type:complete